MSLKVFLAVLIVFFARLCVSELLASAPVPSPVPSVAPLHDGDRSTNGERTVFYEIFERSETCSSVNSYRGTRTTEECFACESCGPLINANFHCSGNTLVVRLFMNSILCPSIPVASRALKEGCNVFTGENQLSISFLIYENPCSGESTPAEEHLDWGSFPNPYHIRI
mmetsp:Transcript_38551/g.62463  ORF Transcript_38551/g.62463 Transcript_38551/m.62463 type:complete len:168 (-) Transcript_38551:348-851(-)